MTKTEGSRSEPTHDQIAELKRAIADLAEAKRVQVETLSASDVGGDDLDQSASPTDTSNPLPSLSIFFGDTGGHWRAVSLASYWVLSYLLAFRPFAITGKREQMYARARHAIGRLSSDSLLSQLVPRKP